MSSIIRMPKMSDTMNNGIITSWLKKIGDFINFGDIIAEINTDKTSIDLESNVNGFILYIFVKENELISINKIIAVVGNKNDNYNKIIKSGFKYLIQFDLIEKNYFNNFKKKKNLNIFNNIPSKRIKSSLLIKKIFKDHNYNFDFKNINNKRIIKRDFNFFISNINFFNNFLDNSKLNNFFINESYKDIVVSQILKVISNRLSQSKFIAPHFYLYIEIFMDNIVDFKKRICLYTNLKISFSDIILKFLSISIRNNLKVNSFWMNNKIRYNYHIHIGVVISSQESLFVPVLRFIDNKSISTISRELKQFIFLVNKKKMEDKYCHGNTFTVSNLGMFGIDNFTSIINSPSSCILSIGIIKKSPLIRNNFIISGNIMKVNLSCDHRVIDGVIGSNFLKTFKEILEDPFKVFL